jgi:hypothetical protein
MGTHVTTEGSVEDQILLEHQGMSDYVIMYVARVNQVTEAVWAMHWEKRY